MDKILAWLKDSTLLEGHANGVLLAVAALLLVNLIVALTKTPEDDARFRKWIQLLSVTAPKDAPKAFKWVFTVITHSQLEKPAKDGEKAAEADEEGAS